MTNAKRSPNDEIRIPKEVRMAKTEDVITMNDRFEIRVSSFFRHSSFVIRHSTVPL